MEATSFESGSQDINGANCAHYAIELQRFQILDVALEAMPLGDLAMRARDDLGGGRATEPVASLLQVSDLAFLGKIS